MFDSDKRLPLDASRAVLEGSATSSGNTAIIARTTSACWPARDCAARTSATRSTLMSATATPSSSPSRATATPAGSTTMLDPTYILPVCPAPITYAVFSIARARSRVSQWSSFSGPLTHAAGYHDYSEPPVDEQPGELREPQVVARHQADREPADLELTPARTAPAEQPIGLPVAERVVQVRLAVGRAQLALAHRAPPACCTGARDPRTISNMPATIVMPVSGGELGDRRDERTLQPLRDRPEGQVGRAEVVHARLGQHNQLGTGSGGLGDQLARSAPGWPRHRWSPRTGLPLLAWPHVPRDCARRALG